MLSRGVFLQIRLGGVRSLKTQKCFMKSVHIMNKSNETEYNFVVYSILFFIIAFF